MNYNMPGVSYVVRLRSQADYAFSLVICQQFDLDILEIGDFDIQVFNYRDYRFLHSSLKRKGMPHCCISCYD